MRSPGQIRQARWRQSLVILRCPFALRLFNEQVSPLCEQHLQQEEALRSAQQDQGGKEVDGCGVWVSRPQESGEI